MNNSGPKLERLILPPASHSSIQSRFTFPASGVLHGPSTVLELALKNLTDTDANCWFIPRCGGFGLINQIELLQDGANLSFINRVDAWAALKSLILSPEEAERMETATKGAHSLDVPPVGSGVAFVNGNNAINSQIIQYSATATDRPLSELGRPLLPLSHIMDFFAKNNAIDLSAHKYELLINWQNIGGMQPCDLANIEIQADTRLFFCVVVGNSLPKELKLSLWYETKFTQQLYPALEDNTTDAQTLPIRFASCKASAVFFAFVDNSSNIVNYNSTRRMLGQARSRPFSASSYMMQLIANGVAILPRPISQDSERLFELGMALDVVARLGVGSLLVPLGTSNRTGSPYYRGHSQLTTDQIGQCCYYGFRLTEDGEPIDLDASGLFLQLNRVSDAAGAVPALTIYAFLVGPKN